MGDKAVVTEGKQRQTINLIPFRITNGTIYLTEAGEYNKNLNFDNFASIQEVVTGGSALIATWQDSTKAVREGTNDYMTKKYKVGRVIKAQVDKDSISTLFEPVVGADDFTSHKMVDNLIVKVDPKEFSRKDKFNLYLIPELGKHQWLYVQTVDRIKHPKTNKEIETVLTLASLGDLMSQSGMAVRQYVQRAGIGEGYAYPKMVDGKVTLDPDLMQDIPVTSLQFEIEGNYALNSVDVQGRPSELLQQGDIAKINKPRKLLVSKILSPIETEITKTGASAPNYVMVNGAVTIDNFTNWQDDISANYNEVSMKNFEGFLKHDPVETRKTNPVQTGAHANFSYAQWHDGWEKDFGAGLLYDTQANQQTGDGINIVGTTPARDVINHNSFIASIYAKLPQSLREHITFSWSSIPIIGKIASVLTFGVPLGWKNTKDIIAGGEQIFFVNAEIDQHAKGMMTVDGLIPLDVFRGEDTPDELTAAVSGKSIKTTWHFELTHKYSTSKDGLNIKDTLDLGQVKPGETSAQLWDGDCVAVTRTLSPSEGYSIDLIKLTGLGKTNVKVTAFRGSEPVYQGVFQTKGKWTGDIREWNTVLRTSPWANPDIVNNENVFDYPKELQPKVDPDGQKLHPPLIFEVGENEKQTQYLASGAFETTPKATYKDIELDLSIHGKTTQMIKDHYEFVDIYYSASGSGGTGINVTSAQGILRTRVSSIQGATLGEFLKKEESNSYVITESGFPPAKFTWVQRTTAVLRQGFQPNEKLGFRLLTEFYRERVAAQSERDGKSMWDKMPAMSQTIQINRVEFIPKQT